MDKKNTMLLTVIAVATLLVAVVGATFAYFNITSTDSGITGTNVNTSVGAAPGAIAFTTETSNLYINVATTQMLEANKGHKLYARTESTGNAIDNVETNHNIVKMAVTGGTTNAKYVCKGTLTADLTVNSATGAGQGTTGEIFVKFSYSDKTGEMNDGATGKNNVSGLTETAQDLKTGQATTNFRWEVEGPNVNYIKANAYVVNTTSEQNDTLQNFEGLIEFKKSGDITCQAVDSYSQVS